MTEQFGPPLRAAAFTAFITGLVLLFLNPPSLAGVGDLVALLAGALAIVLVTAWLTVTLIGREMPEPEFRRLVDRSEALASMPPPDEPPSEFDELVAGPRRPAGGVSGGARKRRSSSPTAATSTMPTGTTSAARSRATSILTAS